MPSKSAKQARFMRIAAHDAAFAKAANIDQSVAREFYEADKKAKRRGTIARSIDKVRGQHNE